MGQRESNGKTLSTLFTAFTRIERMNNILKMDGDDIHICCTDWWFYYRLFADRISRIIIIDNFTWKKNEKNEMRWNIFMIFEVLDVQLYWNWNVKNALNLWSRGPNHFLFLLFYFISLSKMCQKQDRSNIRRWKLLFFWDFGNDIEPLSFNFFFIKLFIMHIMPNR